MDNESAFYSKTCIHRGGPRKRLSQNTFLTISCLKKGNLKCRGIKTVPQDIEKGLYVKDLFSPDDTKKITFILKHLRII